MELLNSLREATRWPHIQYVDEVYVFSIPFSKISSVKGLTQFHSGYILDYDEFQHVPISFNISGFGGGEAYHQYWTLNKVLHRNDDLPAVVSYDIAKQLVVKEWYYGGMRHRTNGAAVIATFGYDYVANLTDYPNCYQETWAKKELSWYTHGIPNVYPVPTSAILFDGYEVRDVHSKKLHSPDEIASALFVDCAIITWEHKDISAISRNAHSKILPTKYSIVNLGETYNQGKMINRTMRNSSIDTVWEYQNGTPENEEQHDKFIELLVEHTNDIQLWSGPFYSNDSTEFIIMSEYK